MKGNASNPETTFEQRVFAGAMAGAVTLLDQAGKWLALRYQAGRPPTDIVPGFLRLAYTTNPGAAWGMFAEHTWLLTVISALALGFLIWQLPTMGEGLWLRVAGLGVLIGGIAGNLIDRLLHGEVIDFIDVHLHFYDWPVFNVADSAICLGIGLYILSGIRREPAKGG